MLRVVGHGEGCSFCFWRPKSFEGRCVASHCRQEKVHAGLPELLMSCVVSMFKCQLCGLYKVPRECLCRSRLLCGAVAPGLAPGAAVTCTAMGNAEG